MNLLLCLLLVPVLLPLILHTYIVHVLYTSYFAFWCSALPQQLHCNVWHTHSVCNVLHTWQCPFKCSASYCLFSQYHDVLQLFQSGVLHRNAYYQAALTLQKHTLHCSNVLHTHCTPNLLIITILHYMYKIVLKSIIDIVVLLHCTAYYPAALTLPKHTPPHHKLLT